MDADIFSINAFEGCTKLDVDKYIDYNFDDYNGKVLDKKFIYKGDSGKKHPLTIEDKSKLSLFFEDEPRMEDIQQGNIGDCWLVASLASIAHYRPDIIKDIIENHPEGGTVRVKLQRELKPGKFRKEFYTIKKSIFKTENGEDVSIMSRFQETIWVQMIEKAFSAYFDKRSNLIDFGNIVGGKTYDKGAFKIILDKEAKNGYFSDNISDTEVKELFERIENALKDNVPLTYGMVEDGGVLEDTEGDEVAYSHDYSLIGAKEIDGKYYIELRNPWGHNFKVNIVDDDYEYIKKSPVIMVDLKKATRGHFFVGNLGDK